MATEAKKKSKKALAIRLDSILVDHVNPTVVPQEDGDSAFHDTVKVSTTADDNVCQALFKAMGISKSAFFKNAPDELPSIKLNAKFEQHVCKIVIDEGLPGTGFEAVMPDATVLDFEFEKAGSTAFEISFKFKGIPMPDHHSHFEDCWLKGSTGVFYSLVIEPPPKGSNELALDNGGESAEKNKEAHTES